MSSFSTILAATDFSESAENAIDYAAAMAVKSKARLILLTAYHVPLVASEVPTLMFTLNELEKEGLQQLKDTEARIRKNHPELQSVELMCLHGFAGETIKNQAEKLKADLVVMGLQGSGFFSEKVIGSNASEMVSECACPVMIIHHQIKFKPIQRILFASDNKAIKSLNLLEPLKTMARLFNAEIFILHVNKEEKNIPGFEAAVEGVALDHFLEGIQHNFYEITAPNITVGLNTFAQKHNIDLSVALARHHGFFESIFRKNNMQTIIYHIQTPILTIHE
ncbi:MAG: universal stress protein [Bacteroidia bacterium]|jgi:nucleotide-binding universal stress UspA family protein|nr:universal stress protein [Bacteroidia bacterium]